MYEELGWLSASRFVQACRAFLHGVAFFWQFNSLDLDSISFDERSLGSQEEEDSFLPPSMLTAAAWL